MKGECYSVWNQTRRHWASSTNFSTREEAEALLKKIRKWCRDEYEIKARPFGSMKE